MAPEKIDRRLAAILSADVVGYSRLMGADEAGTLSDLQAHHAELIDPTIAAHNGRVVKLMGDGVLVEFASVVDAVECAVAIQRNLIERNVKIPSNRRIELRIGINVGDVIVTDDDIFGDGVNVAARLQEFANARMSFSNSDLISLVSRAKRYCSLLKSSAFPSSS